MKVEPCGVKRVQSSPFRVTLLWLTLGEQAAGQIAMPQYPKIVLFPCVFSSEITNQQFRFDANLEPLNLEPLNPEPLNFEPLFERCYHLLS